MNVIEILVPIAFFAMVFGIAYLYFLTRNRERMALIEKGADASLFNTGKTRGSGSVLLNMALLATGIGIGVLCGALLEKAGIEEGVAFPAAIFLFAGLGLLTSYLIEQRSRAKSKGDQDELMR